MVAPLRFRADVLLRPASVIRGANAGMVTIGRPSFNDLLEVVSRIISRVGGANLTFAQASVGPIPPVL